MTLTRVIDCDSIPVESFCEKRDSCHHFLNVTRVESPKIVTRVESPKIVTQVESLT